MGVKFRQEQQSRTARGGGAAGYPEPVVGRGGAGRRRVARVGRLVIARQAGSLFLWEGGWGWGVIFPWIPNLDAENRPETQNSWVKIPNLNR